MIDRLSTTSARGLLALALCITGSACGGGGSTSPAATPPVTLAPAGPAGSDLRDPLAEPLGPLPQQPLVLSALVDWPQDPDPLVRIWIRSENTTVLQTNRRLKPAESLAARGSYVGVIDANGFFRYLARVGDGTIRGESVGPGGEISAAFSPGEGGATLLRFPFIEGGSVVYFEVDPGVSLTRIFAAPLGVAPFPDEGRIFSVKM